MKTEENKIVELYIPATKDPTKMIKVSYTHELAQDLRGICGLDVEAELWNMLQVEADEEYERLYGNE